MTKKLNSYVFFTDENGKERKLLLGSVIEGNESKEGNEPEVDVNINPMSLTTSFEGTFTLKDVENTARKIDYITRPYFLCVNPLDENKLREEIPGIDKKVVLRISDLVEQGKCYLVKRPVIDAFDI